MRRVVDRRIIISGPPFALQSTDVWGSLLLSLLSGVDNKILSSASEFLGGLPPFGEVFGVVNELFFELVVRGILNARVFGEVGDSCEVKNELGDETLDWSVDIQLLTKAFRRLFMVKRFKKE